jgi:hypothetical protein
MIRSNDPEQQAVVDQLIIDRTNTVMNIGFQANLSPSERIAVIDEYRKALRDFPYWAVDKAFDAAAREIPRKPSPAELFTLANRERKPITDEIARRKKEAKEREEDRLSRQGSRCKAEAAERLTREAGFTAKRHEHIKSRPMANSWAEVEEAHDPASALPHWSVGKAEVDPEMLALRAARAANPLMNPAQVDSRPSPSSRPSPPRC